MVVVGAVAGREGRRKHLRSGGLAEQDLAQPGQGGVEPARSGERWTGGAERQSVSRGNRGQDEHEGNDGDGGGARHGTKHGISLLKKSGFGASNEAVHRCVNRVQRVFPFPVLQVWRSRKTGTPACLPERDCRAGRPDLEEQQTAAPAVHRCSLFEERNNYLLALRLARGAKRLLRRRIRSSAFCSWSAACWSWRRAARASRPTRKARKIGTASVTVCSSLSTMPSFT